MTALLIAEHDNKSLKDATNKALTAAKALGQPVHVLVAGKGARAVAEAASATARPPLPATSTCTGCPSPLAAVSALLVASLSAALSCSATKSVVIK